jgi:hypothetical protein
MNPRKALDKENDKNSNDLSKKREVSKKTIDSHIEMLTHSHQDLGKLCNK